MPDISMCANKACPSRSTCYRFRAKPSQWQSWCAFAVPEGATKCDNYWKIDSKETHLAPWSEDDAHP